MGKQGILAGIAKELETISSKNPRDFYYSIERSHEIYANIISMAKDALKEIKEYKVS